ncbi:MAG: sensor histidine kinase, partial [Ruminococcus sp.]|nr:sensor histidine kinase [Ruminococcus sp.]
MPGTRVYADLKIEGNQTSFSLKNVSDQPLNFSSDELTERFIRGDVSRSTEGSGLGLSIAKSLTEMQGGKFELYLDGDLFKVTILFEKVQPVS